MPNILGYYVFNASHGWLGEDEKSWTSSFHDACEFTSHELANDIGERQSSRTETFYIFACLGSP